MLLNLLFRLYNERLDETIVFIITYYKEIYISKAINIPPEVFHEIRFFGGRIFLIYFASTFLRPKHL